MSHFFANSDDLSISSEPCAVSILAQAISMSILTLADFYELAESESTGVEGALGIYFSKICCEIGLR